MVQVSHVSHYLACLSPNTSPLVQIHAKPFPHRLHTHGEQLEHSQRPTGIASIMDLIRHSLISEISLVHCLGTNLQQYPDIPRNCPNSFWILAHGAATIAAVLTIWGHRCA